jgi:hypothetical protein
MFNDSLQNKGQPGYGPVIMGLGFIVAKHQDN